AGHAPLVADVDGDGLDEFVIGFNLVDHDLSTVWTSRPVPRELWDAGEMHVDDLVLGDVGGTQCVVAAASDVAYVLNAKDGRLRWKRKGTHPQHAQIGHFHAEIEGNQVFVHNKRAELELLDSTGQLIWQMMPPENFPLGAAVRCVRQKFHVFDPTTVLPGMGPAGMDMLIFTDGGWPYVINGRGKRCLEFPYTPNSAQDWGEVPGRPDDYGYGFYARVADLDGDRAPEVLINDRRFAWLYEIESRAARHSPPRSDACVFHADFENYVDGVIQPLNAGVRWLGDPFSGREEGTVAITRDFAFSGHRCAHVETTNPAQIARIRLQSRFDAPMVKGDTVTEFVFRPLQSGSADLDDLTVWSAGSSAGLLLLANGVAGSGVYRLDVVHRGSPSGMASERTDSVLRTLPQDRWIRIIMDRRGDIGIVDLWAGPPDSESYVGSYPDRKPEAEFRTAEIGDTSEGENQGSGYWDDVRVGRRLAEGLTVGPPEPALRDVGKELPDTAISIGVGSEKQLFVDEAIIASSKNLERMLHPVRKHPENPVVVPDKPWEGLCVLLYGAVIRDPSSSNLRMWYLAWGKNVGQSSYICYAESEDGLHWKKPSLGLHEFKGSTDNNIVIPDVTSNTTVMYDPRDPDPSRSYKAVIRDRGTRAWLSPAGIRWRDHGVIIDQCYDSTSVHWDPAGEKWIASAKIFKDGKRARGYAESRDFFNWSDTYFMATVDAQDGSDDQMYAMSIFRYESLYLGLLRMYHVGRDTVDIQLASSRNAKHWDRLIRTPFMPCNAEKGSWDHGNNSPSTDPPLRMGDELWFYYSGRSTTHNEMPNRGAIGLGTLRLDGFVSMRAGSESGSLTTKLCTAAGRSLYVNANASEGSLRAEIRDEAGETIAPFSLEDCTPVRTDGVRIALRWGGTSDQAQLAGRTFHLRFELTDAELYAFWAE
ncbi:MAG: hypothetical protein JXB46_12105, partial [Candidatus Eisenbacteria bacterium]|nr:hypothetical protein [Candidatus Eisenbacteria bacterium]